MIKRAVVVDDLRDRAEAFLHETRSRGFASSWWRPMPPSPYDSVAPLDGEIRLACRTSLFEALSHLEENIVWLWDIKLIFHLETGAEEYFDVSDYLWQRDATGKHIGANPMLRELLIARLTQGDRLLLISSDAATSRICQNWIADHPTIAAQIHGDPGSWTDMVPEHTNETSHVPLKSDWIAAVVQKAAMLADFRLPLDLRAETWIEKYEQYFSQSHPNIRHEPGETDKDLFWAFLREWWRIEDTEFPMLKQILVGSLYSSCFFATETLVGHCARCHSSQGYPPCLAVIGLLTIRAALRCRYYDDRAMATLAAEVLPKSSARDVRLSDPLQDREITQKWLCLLGDDILPILVMKHKGGGRSETAIWKGNANSGTRSFTFVYSDIWAPLFEQFHDLACTKGALARMLRDLNVIIGDCGVQNGRRQLCVVNAFHENNRTRLEFAVTAQ